MLTIINVIIKLNFWTLVGVKETGEFASVIQNTICVLSEVVVQHSWCIYVNRK